MLNWLLPSEKVSVATTASEEEAVYRFRYRVLKDELGKPMPAADHENKRLADPEDYQDGAALFYTGTTHEITGTVRSRVWRPGRVPDEVVSQYSLERFPDHGEWTIVEYGRLVITGAARDRTVLPSLMRFLFERHAREDKADLILQRCPPALVRHYRAMGARPFGGRIIEDPIGPCVPLAMFPGDHRHLKACRSVLAPLSHKHYVRGDNRQVDFASYEPLFEKRAGVSFDPAQVWAQFQRGIIGAGVPSVFEGLSERALKRIMKSGYVLEVGPGDRIVREGIVDREVFVVLGGLFEVRVEDKPVRLLGAGEVFGIIAYFSSQGRRTANVVALRPGRVVVLSRTFLREFTRKDPDAGFTLMSNLSRLLADMLAESIAQLDALRPAVSSTE